MSLADEKWFYTMPASNKCQLGMQKKAMSNFRMRKDQFWRVVHISYYQCRELANTFTMTKIEYKAAMAQ